MVTNLIKESEYSPHLTKYVLPKTLHTELSIESLNENTLEPAEVNLLKQFCIRFALPQADMKFNVSTIRLFKDAQA